MGRGGLCNCKEAPGWDDGNWSNPKCHEGNCYAGQYYDECKGKDNLYSLGDGTWCWDEKRSTECSISSGYK